MGAEQYPGGHTGLWVACGDLWMVICGSDGRSGLKPKDEQVAHVPGGPWRAHLTSYSLAPINDPLWVH